MRLILAVFALGLVANAVCQSQYEVVHLTEYMRHGARTTWRNSLNSDLTKEFGVGNLTANGMRMHYVLGLQLRKNYPSIFQPEFNNRAFEHYSSSVYRTMESAASQFMGLYPLGTGEKFHLPSDSVVGLPPFEGAKADYINDFALPHGYRPLPYIIESPELDTVFFPSMYHYCPNAQKYQQKIQAEKMAKYKPLISDLAQKVTELGYDPKTYFQSDSYNIDTLSFFFDEAKVYYNYKGTYMNDMSPDLLQKLAIDTNLNYAWLFPDEKLQRLISDGIARKIVAGMETFISGKSHVTFRMFSGHDTGMFANLLRFGMTNEDCLLQKLQGKKVENCEDVPEFASSFLYELNKKNDQYFVRMLYNGKPVKICSKNQDDFYCTFDDFKAVLQEKLYYNDNDRVEFCGNPESVINKENEDPHFGLKLLIYICVGILLLSLVGFGLIYYKMRDVEKDAYMAAGDIEDTPKSNITVGTMENTP